MSALTSARRRAMDWIARLRLPIAVRAPVVDPIVNVVIPKVDIFPNDEVIKKSVTPSAEIATAIVPVVKIVDPLKESFVAICIFPTHVSCKANFLLRRSQ